MDLAAIVRAGVAIANSATDSLQVTVTHKPFASADARGKPSYGASVVRKALVERLTRLDRPNVDTGNDRLERVPTFKITLLGNVTVNSRDAFVLADGTTGPILSIKSNDDPAGGRYAVEVLIGEGAQSL